MPPSPETVHFMEYFGGRAAGGGQSGCRDITPVRIPRDAAPLEFAQAEAELEHASTGTCRAKRLLVVVGCASQDPL